VNDTQAIKSIKLTSGEEIVGVVHEISESYVEVQSPFVVSKTMGSSFMLLPWMITSEINQIHSINILNVSSVAESSSDFLRAYIKVIKENAEDEDQEFEVKSLDEFDEEMEEEEEELDMTPPDTTVH
tara:strand:+ start:4171 stop:4551 length:381 start_codon:yes stop_codon:yes gene_type:complete